MRTFALGFIVAVIGCPSCSGDDSGSARSTAYQVNVQIVGSATAFTNRVVSLNGIAVQAPVPAPEPGMMHTAHTLCTEDRDRFFSADVRVTVREGERTLFDAPIKRVACKMSDNPGNLEDATIFLRDDGTVDVEFGPGHQTFSACAPPNYPLSCVAQRF